MPLDEGIWHQRAKTIPLNHVQLPTHNIPFPSTSLSPAQLREMLKKNSFSINKGIGSSLQNLWLLF